MIDSSVYVPSGTMTDQGDATRRRIIDAAYELFYRCGYGRAGVDEIADAAGVTKRTLYHHFQSKDALLAAVLDGQHALALERLRRWARPETDPCAMVGELFAGLKSWAAQPAWYGSGFSRAVLELADLPGHPARTAARRHKAAVEDHLREQLERASLRDPALLARQLMALIEGCMVLILVHADPAYADSAALAAQALVERARGSAPTP